MRALLAAVFMICALGKTLAASNADCPAIRGIIQDQTKAFKRDDAVHALFIRNPCPPEHVRIAGALYGNG